MIHSDHGGPHPVLEGVVTRNSHIKGTGLIGPRALEYATVLGSGLALWLLLNEGDLSSLIVGVPAALIGVALSRRLPAAARSRVSARGLLEFIVYFLWQAVVGGWDVARRALGPHCQVQPGFVAYCMSLPEGLPRAVFLDTLTLLPGTLSADVQGEEMRMHVIDVDAHSQEQIKELEHRVARLFGVKGDHP